MKYKGAYDAGTSYDVGDVVVYTDGIPYFLQNPASAGTGCHDTHCWNPVNEELRDAVILFHDMFVSLLSSASDAAATKGIVDAVLFDEKTIRLASSTASSQKTFAITVDDDGDVSATEIVESEGGES